MPSVRNKISDINKMKPIKSVLTAIEYNGIHTSVSGFTKSTLLAKCICGNLVTVIACDMVRGKKISCGCKKGRPKIEDRDMRLYKIWSGMKNRCKNINKKYYGAKGVKVCDEWINSYDSFAEWAVNNKYDKTKVIDKDIKGNGLLYSPETCMFVSRYINSCNRGVSKKYDYNNESLTLSQVSRLENIKYSKLKNLIYINKKSLSESVKICKETIMNG